MSAISRVFCAFALAFSLSGCTPAVYVRLYNATGTLITLAKSQSNESVAIPPDTAADFSPMFLPGELLLIRTSSRVWTYSLRDLFVPQSLLERHLGVLRGYARIDSRGYIYVLSPPHDSQPPQEIPQPGGFPVPPRKKT